MLKRMSSKRRARLAEAGLLREDSTFPRTSPAPAAAGARSRSKALRSTQTPRDTGPSRKTRAAVLIRDGYSCVRCGKACGPGTSEPYSIQHRKARGVGGGSEMPNLILLCGTATTGCHGEVEKRSGLDAWNGYWVPSHADPRLLSVLYARRIGVDPRWYLHDDGSLSDTPDRQ